MQTSPGFIYVVRMGDHDYFKIGRSTDVRRRMSELQLPCAGHLLFAYRVADASKVESQIHREFEHVRMNGEWFRLTESHLTEIRAHLLFVQANDLINRVLQAIATDRDLFPHRLTQYGKVIMRMGTRAERRLDAYATFHQARTVAEFNAHDVLEAEFLG